MAPAARLYLIPVPIDDNVVDTIPEATLKALRSTCYFVAERGKTARRYIRLLGHPKPQNEITVAEIPKHGSPDMDEIKDWLTGGNDVGILSESGCPGIADPGSEIVAWAHRQNIEVVPLVGPSSILLALMASGFSGQSFVFHGYLPTGGDELVKKLRSLESQAVKFSQSQIFIETPYRNRKLFNSMLQILHDQSRLSVHTGLTGPLALSRTMTVKQWKKSEETILKDDVPAVFIIG